MIKVAGWSPIADLNYPRVVMPSLFIHGCNFRCPYCINRDLVIGDSTEIDLYDLLAKFKKMKEEWVCVTGAEALMNVELPSLLKLLKKMKFKIALSTNGTYFDRLKNVCETYLVDHVVMDIKTDLDKEKYKKVAGINIGSKPFKNLLKSIDYLKNGDVSYEFRTTMCKKYVSYDDVVNIAKYIGKDSLYVLQLYTTHQTLDPELSDDKYVIPYETLQEWGKDIEPFVKKLLIREV